MVAMLAGPLTRKRKNQKRYKMHAVSVTSSCEFCDFMNGTEQVKKEYPHFWIVLNIFGYDNWDGFVVTDHLMVVPKRHVDSISHFTPTEAKSYLELLAEYEAKGYSIYARAADNKAKSIVHQHTHLIKLNSKRIKAMAFVHKPHVVMYI